MSQELIPVTVSTPKALQRVGLGSVPALFASAGEQGTRRFIEFFTANIRNKNTRLAYAQAVQRFAGWCEGKGFRLEELTPVHVAGYVELLGQELAKPSVKQHLAAIRMLFDYLVTGQVVPHNPAASVRGPKYVLKKGKTPVLNQEEARTLLASINTRTIAGLRDRALIGVMVYSFARISAVLGMDVEDYYQQGKRWWIALHEKGGKEHAVPAHHKAEEFLDAYLAAAGIADQKGMALFRTLGRRRQLTANRLDRREALLMVKRRARQAELGERICNHTFRATGITAYLEGGGTVEKAQAIAAHESPRTTKLYDRTSDELTLDEIEKIQI
jgi:integrase/recombinase XerD